MGARIYVGNLALNAEEKDLKESFSKYGTISDIVIKSKLGFDDQPIAKFAYLNLKADSSQIGHCVSALNGFTLGGSALKVELAKESFLDRLKREREQANLPKETLKETNFREDHDKYKFSLNTTKNYQTAQSYNNYDNDASRNEYHDEVKGPKYGNSFHTKRNEYQDEGKSTKYGNSFDTPRNEYEEKSSNNVNSFNSNLHLSDEDDDDVNGFKRSNPNFQKNNKYGRHRGYDFENDRNQGRSFMDEVRSYSGFKRFDPSSEKKKLNTETAKNSIPPQRPVPKVPEDVQMTKKVVVSSGLSFKNESAGFSLLQQFSQDEPIITDEKEEEAEPFCDAPEELDERQNETIQPLEDMDFSEMPKKGRRFFIDVQDPDFKASVEWITTALTDENKAEFESVRPELIDIYKLKHYRAERDVGTPQNKTNNSKNKRFGKSLPKR